MAYGFKTLEKKYGIHVVADGYWHPLTGKFVGLYNVYSADGCCWEKGLTRKGVKKECAEWADSLLEIKANCGK